MAENFATFDDITYCGQEAEEIFVKNLYSSDLKGYGIRYMGGVKGKKQLMSGEVSDLYQAYSCPFSPKGKATLEESFIEPVKIKVNLEECYDSFWDTFMSKQTEITLNGGIPQTFFNWFFDNVMIQELKKEYEDLFWNADKAYTGSTREYLKLGDGIVKQLRGATGSTKVTGVALTVANVLDKIGEVAAKVDELENDVEGYKIFVNYKDYRKMLTALGENSPLTVAVWSNFTREGDKVYAYGMEVVPCRIDANTIVASHPMNLILGYDVADSEIAYKIVDMRDKTMDNTFRVGIISNIAMGVVYPSTAVVTTAIA